MRIYVAGAAAEIERCEQWIVALQARGHVVTQVWTEAIRAVMAADPLKRDRDLPMLSRCKYAMEDINGIRSAELLWLLVPAHKGIGCWFEAGVAYERGITMVVSGHTRRSIFCALTPHEFDTDELAFSFIISI